MKKTQNIEINSITNKEKTEKLIPIWKLIERCFGQFYTFKCM